MAWGSQEGRGKRGFGALYLETWSLAEGERTRGWRGWRWGREGVGETSRHSRLLMSTLHFSDGRDTDVSEEADGVAAGLRAALFTFLPSALSNPTFLRLREKSFSAVIRSPGKCRCIG